MSFLMVKLQLSNRYQHEAKHFVNKNKTNLDAIKKTLRLFLQNPSHPSLKMEKLKGSLYWTIRISLSNRIFFIWIDKKTALLIDIGQHDKYRKF